MNQFPFVPLPAGSQTVSVGASVVNVTLDARATSVWVDNRGSVDLLVQFGATPALADATGFRVPAGVSQPLQVPVYAAGVLQVKRPSGSASETAYISSGGGF